jgi:hypothetical protein
MMMNSTTAATLKSGACAFFICVCALAGGGATAAIVSPAAAVTVTASWAYTSYDGGDFVFSTSATATGCGSGWYISSADPGYKAAVSTVLTAQASGSFVVVYGDNSLIWPGSPTGKYCRVQAVGISS